jgi:hypothetical protein
MEELTGIAKLLQSYGPYGVAALAIGYGYLERSERQKLQEENKALQKNLIEYATNQYTQAMLSNQCVKTSIESLKEAMDGIKELFTFIRDWMETHT